MHECVGVKRKGIYLHIGFTTIISELTKELGEKNTDRFYLQLKNN